MKLCANLTVIFTELPLKERFAAAKLAGFSGVEVLFPYDDPVPEIVDQILVDEKSSRQLVGAIHLLYGDGELRKTLGARNRQFVLENYHL